MTTGRALWRWWNTRFMARFGRFLLFLVAVAAYYALLRINEASMTTDARTSVFIAFGSSLIALTTTFGVLFITGSWTLRATGVVGFSTAVALFFVYIADGHYHWFDRKPWMLDVVRAWFVPSIPLLIAGVGLWAYRVWRETRPVREG